MIIERRHQNFQALGGFARPGTYQVPRPNFRLLDAISLAGDLQPGIETVYVIRAYDFSEPAAQTRPAVGGVPTGPAGGAAAAMPATVPAAGLPAGTPAPATANGQASVAGQAELPPATQAMPTEAEMQAVLPSGNVPDTQIAASQPRKLIAVGDQWVEVPARRRRRRRLREQRLSAVRRSPLRRRVLLAGPRCDRLG